MDITKINKTTLITKANGETGTIEAYITTFDNKDKVGDVIKKGALDEFITKFDKGETDTVRLLLNHNRDVILGKWVSFKSDDHGVLGTAKFSDVQSAKDIQTLIKDGILDSVSVGMTAMAGDFKYRDGGGMEFTKIGLRETSIVDLPANPKAKITAIKSDSGEINKRALEQNLRDAGCSTREAKTIVSIVEETLPNIRDEYAEEKSIAEILSTFTLNKEK